MSPSRRCSVPTKLWWKRSASLCAFANSCWARGVKLCIESAETSAPPAAAAPSLFHSDLSLFIERNARLICIIPYPYCFAQVNGLTQPGQAAKEADLARSGLVEMLEERGLLRKRGIDHYHWLARQRFGQIRRVARGLRAPDQVKLELHDARFVA